MWRRSRSGSVTCPACSDQRAAARTLNRLNLRGRAAPTVYPALYRIEEEGWIASEWGASENNRRAKFYRLTRSGERQLAREQQNWRRLASAVFPVLETA